MQALSFWDDLQLIIPFVLGVLFFRFCVPRRQARVCEEEDVCDIYFRVAQKEKELADDDELVSTAAGSDTDESSSEDLVSSASLSRQSSLEAH
jgi:hypothetical protein